MLITCLLCFYDSYVPSHLHLMVFELVKNSLRAVQERFMNSDKDAPPIRIIVADGIEDVTIKVYGILHATCSLNKSVNKFMLFYVHLSAKIYMCFIRYQLTESYHYIFT